jgi:hypothetical protein
MLTNIVLGPTFRLTTSEPADEFAARLDQQIKAWTADPASPYKGNCVGRHAQLTSKPPHHHFWSPHLTLDIRDTPDLPEPTALFARFNPSPAIWTGYMLTSLALITTAFIGLFYASAQVMLDQSPTAAWTIPITTILLIAMWATSAAGQRLAKGEIESMQHDITGFVAETLSTPHG